MLDKSVPHVSFLMRRPKGSPVPEYKLPAGYKFALYKPGDEGAWAAVETSVLEFESEAEALEYFNREFAPHLEALKQRCLFVEHNGEKVATCTAWWCCPERCLPRLHWVAAKPDYQGLGLGKAIVSECTRRMISLDGDVDFFLSTQTGSHRAVKIYAKFGYAVTGEKKICRDKNENHEQALAVLRQIYGE